ncbi:MAG: acetyl-CoA carboxylase biotin carboxyl carrier protein subunit [Candidatus Zixiibacteriota bacterium]
MSSYQFIVGDSPPVVASVERKGGTLNVQVDDATCELTPLNNNLYACVINGKRLIVAVARYKDTWYVDIDSTLLEVREPSEDGFSSEGGGHTAEKDKIYAPMPGKIVKISVAVGDSVKPGQTLVVVEAMKMENPVLSKASGQVKSVNFAAGDQVNTENPIIELDLQE